jgi:hypothetical protein
MFSRKSIFENFKISKSKIISFDAAKVLPIVLNFWHVRGHGDLGSISVSLLGCPQFRRIFSQ